MAGGLTEPELTELARLLPPGRPFTETVLAQAGFDETLLPSGAASTREYWMLIDREIRAGTVADGRRRVIAAALERFPYNEVLTSAVRRPATWRILFLGSSPDGLRPVRADRELRRMRDTAGPIEIRDVAAATATDLNRIRTDRPDILHLAAHGRGAELVFDTGAGRPHTVHAGDIADALGVYRRELGLRLRGVVLNACDSAEAAERLSDHADVVVAHRDDLADEDGIAFAHALYGTLGQTDDLAAAARIAAGELVRDDPARRRLATGLVVLERSA